MTTLQELVALYFNLGLYYKDIAALLASRHHYMVSIRHLKRILKSCNLFRRKGYSDLDQAITFIHEQLQTSGQLHGYRWMYTKCKESGINIRKEDVRLILRELDPRGVDLRVRRRLRRRNYFAKGPNYIWHLDSYDKLKPFGICINGCIDGFSRKIIWMNAFTTSSDPKLIGGYYIEAVERLGGCPRIVRGDRGTENGKVRDCQRYLRRNIHDGSDIDSYIEGASTANQRIESWWGFLRRESMEFYICLFADLKDRGLFDGAYLDRGLIQFCFMGIIQDELDETTCVWDSHVIRPSKNDKVPSGRPRVMYMFPELYRTDDCISPVERDDLQLCQSSCTFRTTVPCDTDIYNICNFLMVESQLHLPADAYQALDLYLHLRNEIRSTL
ncbi:uncharacterized protein [Misgurnus anguillicaudatus]|uniref:uncharacterized protein n=1 Tax=Misgurnus anguillicaudatus TaxID=75329 RepID=UPI002435C288|nr:uncharacterized protein LOC129446405 [Misgurnus anguillicaudatus]XP_055076027.1 uncharacterized protein LOC129455339 [Misgurnus anguillicaudatus]